MEKYVLYIEVFLVSLCRMPIAEARQHFIVHDVPQICLVIVCWRQRLVQWRRLGINLTLHPEVLRLDLQLFDFSVTRI